MQVQHFFETVTSTLSYIVYDEESKDAVIIDPVLDYTKDDRSVRFDSINLLNDFCQEKGLNVHYLIETHVHADHLSGSKYLQEKLPHAKTVISHHITKVQDTFQKIFQLNEFKSDGHQFNVLVKDGDILKAGNLEIKVIETPGHTPACTCFLIKDCLFTGDAIFMPDFGTGRCDFPAGSAEDLYQSIHGKIYGLPNETKIYVGHDYQPGGRELAFQTTVAESKKQNKHIRENTSLDEFVKFRTERDKQLKEPSLLYHSLQININAGSLPKDNLLRLPLNI